LNHFSKIEKTIDWGKFLNNVLNRMKTYNAKYYIKKDLAAYK